MSKNEERARLCNRIKDAGYPSPRKVARQAKVSLTKCADVLVKLQKAATEKMLYGQALFTGNTRVYSNGTIGSEIRCRHCGLTYWETGLPYALCVDCRCMVVRKF